MTPQHEAPMPYQTTIDYMCGRCQSRGVKLWRGVHGANFEGKYELLCAPCVAPQGTMVDDNGKGKNEFVSYPIDQVGNGLPAIPTLDTFWGYGSVPAEGVAWWRALPTYGSAMARTGTGVL